MERGTLYQLRNLISRRNVKKTPKGNVNASEDFLEVVVIGYILAAVMSYLGMSSLDDIPLESIVPHDIWMEDDTVRWTLLQNIAKHVVEKYVDLSTEFKDPAFQPDASTGTVLEYSCEMLSLGLLLLEFKDAVREGDGDRDLLVWKYFMLLFKATGRKNYAIEALTLLSQYHLTLPPSLAEQLKWSRFVNVHGIAGHNISCDLHMEHLNRSISCFTIASRSAFLALSECLPLGTETPTSLSYELVIAASMPMPLPTLLMAFHDLLTPSPSTAVLTKSSVFDPSITSKHKSFPNIKANLIRTLEEKSVKDWMIERFSVQDLQYSPPNDIQSYTPAEESDDTL
jgi:L1 cell adhesion molecule like protein